MPIRSSNQAARTAGRITEKAITGLGRMRAKYAPATCNRKRELLDAKWEYFDLERRSWRIPTSKTGKARHVPLSAAMLSVLSQVPRWPGCSYVVPNQKTKKPFVQ